MIEAVVVDVDDTLCLTEAVCFELENEVLAALGREPMSRAVHLATWGEPLLDAMPKRSPGLDVGRFDTAYRQVLRQYVRDGRLDVIAPENLRTLDQFVEAGRALLLLTSRTEAEVDHLLAPDHVLAERVSAVYHAGNTRFGKPDPRVFDELLAATGLAPRQCVYVGDSPGDALAAGGAGLHFIACLQSGVRRREDFDARHVSAFIQTFPELVDAVRQLDAHSAPTTPQAQA
ncbi:HAD hydrolase-like protein [Micromonospora yasonensis]|uniref:HAD family hydrolase n=1 Tax=Micromonospora yasonensis TaxID=1128667 RepID=UPI00223282D7|nr:HAD hydrolase-like protein [Micromonospora yasonensis]MCW3842285.1 HAD hydrolase-like protein [Micromonospora yasonensis]